ncbi:hypothetical protein ATANTOWER_001345, partial [Ataeniobius toweri]|nr:hypothetical protein [Ataeniobius toweri]
FLVAFHPVLETRGKNAPAYALRPSLPRPRLSPVCLSSHQGSLLVNKGVPLSWPFLSLSLCALSFLVLLHLCYPSVHHLFMCSVTADMRVCEYNHNGQCLGY